MFNAKFYVSALVGVIIKVILQNARCNNKDISSCYAYTSFHVSTTQPQRVNTSKLQS